MRLPKLFKREKTYTEKELEQAQEQAVKTALTRVLGGTEYYANQPLANYSADNSPYAVPKGAPPYPLYKLDNPLWWNTPQNPKRRPDTNMSSETMRRIADTYDVLRACINHLKREVVNTPIRVMARDQKDDSQQTLQHIKDATEVFRTSGIIGGKGYRRAHYESVMIEDVCVLGAFASYFDLTVGGMIKEVINIDGSTIRPRVDAYGWDDKKAYEQWIHGAIIRTFTREELIYDGVFPVAHSPYFRSPIEWLMSPVTSAIKADEWNRMWLTEGNTPDSLIALPDNWSASQVREFSQWWNELMADSMAERVKMKFVPGGSQRVATNSRKDQEFHQFERWMMLRTCAVYGVQPVSIGMAEGQYRVSQRESMRSTSQFGAGTLMALRKDHYDDILERLGYGNLEVITVFEEEDDAKSLAERTLISVGVPWKSINEARKAEGFPPIEGGDQLMAPIGVRTLEQAMDPKLNGSQLIAEQTKNEADLDPNAKAESAGGAPGGSPAGKSTAKSNAFSKSTGEMKAEARRSADLDLWARKAIRRMEKGKSPVCEFISEHIDEELSHNVMQRLAEVTSREEILGLFWSYKDADQEAEES